MMHKWPFYPALYPPWKVPQPSPGAWWLTPANASGKAALLCSTSTAAYFARTDPMTSPAELADRVEGRTMNHGDKCTIAGYYSLIRNPARKWWQVWKPRMVASDKLAVFTVTRIASQPTPPAPPALPQSAR